MDNFDSKCKAIIDTDIGDDIDDSFALALATQLPELEILGVVTVFKDVRARCRMAKLILELAGRSDISVYQGLSRPLQQIEMFEKTIDFSAPLWSYIPDADRFEQDFPDGMLFYEKTLENTETPIKIITIGSLTNVGRLLQKRPDLSSKISELVIMGGAYDMNYSEYNFSCDPEAAHLVLSSAIPKTLVGLDVTFQCYLEKDDIRALGAINHPLTNTLTKLIRPNANRVFLHDPLALYCARDRKFVKFRKEVLAIELNGKYTRGNVVKMCNCNWNKNPEDSCNEYAYEVDRRGFVDEYLRCMAKLVV